MKGKKDMGSLREMGITKYFFYKSLLRNSTSFINVVYFQIKEKIIDWGTHGKKINEK
jgi:hypothetical protein